MIMIMTMPQGWFIIPELGHDIVYLSAKLVIYSFSRSTDIIGPLKFKMGHVTSDHAHFNADFSSVCWDLM